MDIYITAAAVIGAATGAALMTGWFNRRGKISEFRQKWINELRADVAEFLGAMRRYHDAESNAAVEELRYEADTIYNRIMLRINPRQSRNKKQDDEFLEALKALLKKGPEGSLSDEEAEKKWHNQFDRAMCQARELLKREWEVTKSPLLAGAGRGQGIGRAGQARGRMAGLARTLLPALGLSIALGAAIVALAQLGDTKRAVSLGSFAMVREGYSVPKMQFYEWLFENGEQLATDNPEPHIRLLTQMYAMEYLRSIEFVAEAYVRGLLDEQARRFVTGYVKADIEHLLFCFYREGSIDFTEDIGVSWIRLGNAGWSDIGGYPATLALAEEVRIKLATKDCLF